MGILLLDSMRIRRALVVCRGRGDAWWWWRGIGSLVGVVLVLGMVGYVQILLVFVMLLVFWIYDKDFGLGCLDVELGTLSERSPSFYYIPEADKSTNRTLQWIQQHQLQ